MPPKPHIALLVETSTSFGRGIIQGISEYSRIHGPWVFYIRSAAYVQTMPTREEWPCDGVIARIATPTLAKSLRQRKLPVVQIAGRESPQWPFIGTSPSLIGQFAADYFLDRGFQRFGFYGYSNQEWATLRERAFVAAVAKRGCTCSIMHDVLDMPIPQREEKIGRWLQDLPKPAAILASDDMHGREILDICRVRDIHVPEEIAVCGIDNDEMMCMMATPSLSSVPLNTRRIGFEAAATLHRMMNGQPGQDMRDIEPLAVVTRQSTDLLAIDDPIVAEAVSMIRQSASEGLTVKQILRQIPTSRRTLEYHFLSSLGRSPHDEIRRVQLARAKDLLIHTDLKTSEVARLSGFVNAQYLNNVFRQTFSQTPAEYRRSNRIA